MMDIFTVNVSGDGGPLYLRFKRRRWSLFDGVRDDVKTVHVVYNKIRSLVVHLSPPENIPHKESSPFQIT